MSERDVRARGRNETPFKNLYVFALSRIQQRKFSAFDVSASRRILPLPAGECGLRSLFRFAVAK